VALDCGLPYHLQWLTCERKCHEKRDDVGCEDDQENDAAGPENTRHLDREDAHVEKHDGSPCRCDRGEAWVVVDK